MNEIVKRAYKINGLQKEIKMDIPNLEIGETTTLKFVWDGNGENPIEDKNYSYIVTENGEDGESNYQIDINYSFEVLEVKEDVLESIIKIISIDLI